MNIISVIIVNYNTKKFIIDSIRSIYRQDIFLLYEILVVDNNSSDDSVETIAREYPDVILITSKKNIGFAQANNLAAAQAKGEYLLLLNPDTVIFDNAIQKLYNFALTHPANLIYGGRTLYQDCSLNPTSCWKKMTLWSLLCYATGLPSIFRRNRLFDPESYGSWQRDTVREVDIVTGCFLLIKTTFWQQLGGFDSAFFMYGEDADLCLRGKQQGAKPVITPDATIIHYGGASEPLRADKMIRLFRAKEQLIRRHWHIGARFVGVSLLRTSVFTRMLVCNILQLIGFNQFYQNAKCWSEIWNRRREWHI